MRGRLYHPKYDMQIMEGIMSHFRWGQTYGVRRGISGGQMNAMEKEKP
jgi:hypothetical protein